MNREWIEETMERPMKPSPALNVEADNVRSRLNREIEELLSERVRLKAQIRDLIDQLADFGIYQSHDDR